MNSAGFKDDREKYYSYEVKNIAADDFHNYWPDTRTRVNLPKGQKNYSLKLPFDVTFYNHPVSELFIFPEGFVSVSNIKTGHDSRYIAPLPIAFECHHSNTSSLSYWLDKNKNQSVTVQWEDCVPKNIPMKLPFTFRLKVWRKGLIEFIYKKLGISIQTGILDFLDDEINIGISDSITTGNFTYKYHEVNVPQKYIAEHVLVSIRPLPGSCIEMDSCDKCVKAFRDDHHCYWCPDIDKCLSGMDFHKPAYLSARCSSAKEETVCKMKKFLPFVEETTTVVTVTKTTQKPRYNGVTFTSKTKYYNATLITDPERVEALWINVSEQSKIITGVNDWIKLPFPFPFFGDRKTHFKITSKPGQIRFKHSTPDPLFNIYASGIYMLPTHVWEAPPPMQWGEFTKVESKESFDRVTIQWTLISRTKKDEPAPCYQATLFADGNIDFVYKKTSETQSYPKPSEIQKYSIALGLIHKFLDERLSFNVAIKHKLILSDMTAVR